jgi:hypothetical protein
MEHLHGHVLAARQRILIVPVTANGDWRFHSAGEELDMVKWLGDHLAE